MIEPVAEYVPSGERRLMDWSDWGLTLSRAVSGDKVDYGKLLEDRRPLDRFLALVSCVGPRTSPDLFPDNDHRLAYAVNCYNAVIVASVLELARASGTRTGLFFDLERQFCFRVDGRLQSPADLRRTAMELAADDWRVRLVLCAASSPGPPLPRRALLGDLLDAQLNEAARSALSSPQVVRIDHGEDKRLLVWDGLFLMKDRLIREYESRTGTKDATLLSVLLEWSDRTRREELNSAVGYAVAMMPAAHEINSLAPPPLQKKGLFSGLRSISFIRPQ